MRRCLLTAAAAVLAAGPLGAQPRAATMPFHSDAFRVQRVGRGRPMVLIPGLASSGEVWRSTVERFQGRYECHVLTIAGFAGVPGGDARPFLAHVRDEVLRYLRQQGLRGVVLVGHSLGGTVALWAAAHDTGHVAAVVSVDGVPYVAPLMLEGVHDTSAVRTQAEAFRRWYAGLTPAQEGMQTRMGASRLLRDTTRLSQVADWSAASDPRVVGQAVYEMLTTDLRDSVVAVHAPVLLVGAAEFARDSAERAQVTAAYEDQVRRVPHHRVTVAWHARHFVMYDDPEFLFAEMERFLVGGAPTRREPAFPPDSSV
ncbi:MAG: alpha/beta fold hydrolase [Gemmatimonadetes bacterium]|nr:alpha/beta fold hydrolase [Gemmatimonadota bacterium]